MADDKQKSSAKRSAKAPSGAARSRHSWKHPLRSWFGSHRDSARQALERLRLNPLSSAMTILVMTIVLALPMGLAVLIGQIERLGVD